MIPETTAEAVTPSEPTLARLPPSELEQWRESKRQAQTAAESAEPELTDADPAEKLDALPVETPAKPKKKGSISERFSTLTQRAKEAEDRERVERDRRESLERELETLRRPASAVPASRADVPSSPAPTLTGKPDVGAFETYDAYVEALTDWKLEQKAVAAQEAEAQKTRQASKAAAVDGYRSKIAEARTRYPDFDTVTANAQIPLTPALEEILLTSDYGPDLSYYLSTHLDEATQIIAKDPAGQIRALGQLEARLEQARGSGRPAKPAVSISAAPPPVSPVGGGATASVAVDASTATLAQWRKAKQARLGQRR